MSIYRTNYLKNPRVFFFLECIDFKLVLRRKTQQFKTNYLVCIVASETTQLEKTVVCFRSITLRITRAIKQNLFYFPFHWYSRVAGVIEPKFQDF